MNPKISILTPLYNSDLKTLEETILSVINQKYQNWELCLVDGSTEENNIEELVKKYQKDNANIKYKKLDKNLGISGNTNECLKLATGEYISILDHDDVLYEETLEEVVNIIKEKNPDVIYTDEDMLDLNGKHTSPFYKPDFSKDLLMSQNYICHFLTIKKSIVDKIGMYNSKYDGAQDYDFMLRVTEETTNIYHIPKLLYSWRQSPTSTSVNLDSKPYAHLNGLQALDDHLKRVYKNAYAEETDNLLVYKARFKLEENKKAALIIPMKDKYELTNDCVRSVIEKTKHQNYEILILDNCSEEKETKNWFKEIVKLDSRIKVIEADMEFNWSKLNNFGIKNVGADVYVFLNNDTLVINEDWLEILMENALRDEVGVVGPLLVYDDDTIQHAGVVIGMNGWADHVFKAAPQEHLFPQPFVSPVITRNVMAVTGACMAISKDTLDKIGYFNEDFIICGSDVEICIRAYKNNLSNVYVPYSKLYHLESKSRDSYIPPVDFEMSEKHYKEFWEKGDPFYNINLDINSCIPKDKKDIIINKRTFKQKVKDRLRRNKFVVTVYRKLKGIKG